MIPEERLYLKTVLKTAEKLADWSVTECYDRWTPFALNGSNYAFIVALQQARKESEERRALVNKILGIMVEAKEAAIKESLLVYVPRSMLKDWR